MLKKKAPAKAKPRATAKASASVTAPKGGKVVTLVAHDRSDPLLIHINGVKAAEMYCGKPCELTAEAFAHLEQTPGITYEENT